MGSRSWLRGCISSVISTLFSPELLTLSSPVQGLAHCSIFLVFVELIRRWMKTTWNRYYYLYFRNSIKLCVIIIERLWHGKWTSYSCILKRSTISSLEHILLTFCLYIIRDILFILGFWIFNFLKQSWDECSVRTTQLKVTRKKGSTTRKRGVRTLGL